MEIDNAIISLDNIHKSNIYGETLKVHIEKPGKHGFSIMDIELPSAMHDK